MNFEDTFISITDDAFKDFVLESKDLIIIIFEKNFWGAAQIMKNILKELASKHKHKFKLYKYDLEEFSTVSNEFEIYDQIAILFFKDGNLFKKTGVNSKPELEKILSEMVNN